MEKTLARFILHRGGVKENISQRGPLDLQTLYALVQWNASAKKGELGGRGVGGVGIGDFWDSIGNVNEENT